MITGTKGYIWVPAPWWKKQNILKLSLKIRMKIKSIFYQLDGEGIRYEIVAFAKAVTSGKPSCYITDEVSISIASVIDKFEHKEYIRLG